MDSWRPSVLVLGPGGIKGYYEIGSVAALWEHGLLDNVKHYVGVSVGSILCLLLVIGFTPDDIMARFTAEDVLSDLCQIDGSRKAIFSNQPVVTFLRELVKERIGFVPTLRQLAQITDRTFTAVTLNLTQQTVEYVNGYTEPSLSCVDAVAMSINIPGIFEKIVYRGNVYVDGALGNPYPVDAFDDQHSNVLGISVLTRIDPDEVVSYIASNIDCAFYHMHRIIKERASSKCKHLSYAVKMSSFLGINLPVAQRQAMFAEGHHQAKLFLAEVGIPEEGMLVKSTYPADDIDTADDACVDGDDTQTLPPLDSVVTKLFNSGNINDEQLVHVLHVLLDCVRLNNETGMVTDILNRLQARRDT